MNVDIGQLVVVFLVLIFSLTVHESAHAWTAAWLGDLTAKRLGRITLNPVAHVDPIGTIVLPFLAFTTGAPVIGWAKPVPVNPANLKKQRQYFLYISAAGPVSNIALAVVASVALRVLPVSPISVAGGLEFPAWNVAATLFELNLLLAVFNFVPIPPLDGANVLAGVLPENLASIYDRVVRPWGFVILYALLLTGGLSAIISSPYLFLSRLLTG